MAFQRLIDQIEHFRGLDDWGTPVFKKWIEDVQHSLEVEFGTDSRQSRQFEKLDFVGPLFFRDENRNYFQETVSQAKVMLQLFEDELSESSEWNGFWADIHPDIEAVSRDRYYRKSYADSVEAALKELNYKIKLIVKDRTGQEYDGADLMNKAFSVSNPIIKLESLFSESEKSIQKGYQLIFSGAMTGIRNPKAHQNLIIDQKRARHHIYLASLLAYVVDEEYRPNQLSPTTPPSASC